MILTDLFPFRRYMMLIDGEDQTYFADRDNAIFRARGLTFPYRKNPSEHLADTLVDGVTRGNGDGNCFCISGGELGKPVIMCIGNCSCGFGGEVSFGS